MTIVATRRQFLARSTAAAAAPLFMGFPVLAQTEDQLVIALSDDMVNIDPAFRIGPVEDNILSAVCQRLARFKPGSLDWEPEAAKSITQVSDTEIEFELHPGQLFHGGFGELTADDVKFTYERVITPGADGNATPYAEDFSALDRVEVTGTYTGKLHLKNPAPALFVIGICDGTGSLLSRKAFDELGADAMATRAIGSGPYMFKEWRPREQIVIEANPDYSGSDTPAYARIVAKPIAETRTALLALLAGEVALAKLEVTEEDQLAANDDIEAVRIDGIGYTWVGMNVEKGPLQDLKVRQAIRLGIDVPTIIDGAYGGKVTRANSLLAPPLLGYWAEAPVYERSVADAKALLAESGQSNLALTFTCLNDPISQATAAIVQANLADIGVTVTINALDPGAYWAMGSDDASKDLELTLIPYESKFDPSFQTQWFLGAQVGIWNWQRWVSPEFDQLHAEAAATLDEGERQAKYVRMQQLLDESASCVWITHGVHVYGHAKALQPSFLPNGTNFQLRFFRPA
ncbi:MAG: ABC transporter substrate-binding protein [Paracoccaceae bacterium]